MDSNYYRQHGENHSFKLFFMVYNSFRKKGTRASEKSRKSGEIQDIPQSDLRASDTACAVMC